MRALVAWRGGLFMTDGEIGVLSVFSLFLARVGVYVGVGVCIRTHTHTHCTCWVLRCEPWGRDETPGGPEESRWTTYWHICIRIRVQILIHVCLYMLGGGMKSWTNCFSFKHVFPFE